MKYTKGEWYLEEETGLILSIPEGKDSPVIVANVGGSVETITPKPLWELSANAHLIASAPDLYEACKLVATFFEQGNPKSITGGDMKEAVTKALAKAEGK